VADDFKGVRRHGGAGDDRRDPGEAGYLDRLRQYRRYAHVPASELAGAEVPGRGHLGQCAGGALRGGAPGRLPDAFVADSGPGILYCVWGPDFHNASNRNCLLSARPAS